MSSHGLDALKAICTRLVRATTPSYEWTWDGRFQTALLVFGAADREKICSELISLFMGKWDVNTIEKASVMVREHVGGRMDIKPGQVIFASDNGVHTLLFAAWWPWGDGTRISLRVGLCAERSGAGIEEKQENLLREWFTIRA
mgnify:CR=1 FL=1